MTNLNKEPNRLITEKSPYLLQHAYNPVDWYPWGKEAFDKAKNENKPIFLSIGYSVCHWCHVMAKESFEDNEVAEVLNRDFISIKVDKEERPDIDTVYMNVCQILTGQGGWPTTIIMTPDQKPFFAGTYFPKKAVYGRPGLLDILEAIKKGWKQEKETLIKTGEHIVSLLNEEDNQFITEESPDKQNEIENDIELEEKANSLIISAKHFFEESFDERYGGFGKSPKFPTPHHLLLLLKLYEKEKNEHSLEMVEKTLKQMYRGGIYDHIGGGFCRYSTDQQWLVPHFEKMLYDNALLSLAYIETFKLTGEELYMEIVQDTLDYILREMTNEKGGFYSAQDADSEGKEGKYYLFQPEEILQVLGKERGESFCKEFDITENGNFEGDNIPNLLKNSKFQLSSKDFQEEKKKIYEYRLNRMRLHKDDKILTAWNGMMITAFSQAYAIFGKRAYLEAAEKTAGFIVEKMTKSDGTLHVHYRNSEAVGSGYLDDYAYCVWGFIELYEASHRVIYLQNALDYNKIMLEEFWDEKEGGFFFTSNDSEKLISRPKETYDGAIPSGNSVAAYNLIRLARKMENSELEELAKRQVQFLLKAAKKYPSGHSFALLTFYNFFKK